MTINMPLGSGTSSPAVVAISPLLSPPESQLISKLRALTAVDMNPTRLFKLTEACENANDKKYNAGNYNNICTFSEYNDTMCVDLLGVGSDFRELLDQVRGEKRPYIAFFSRGRYDTDPVRTTLIKIGDKSDSDQVFDAVTRTFAPLNDTKVAEIRGALKPECQIVFFNGEAPRAPPVYIPAFYHTQETTFPISAQGVFFHQRQESTEGICGVCALNNCFGKQVTDPNELTQFNQQYYTNMGLVCAALPGGHDTGTLVDAAAGNDPQAIKEYVVELARNGAIDSLYERTEIFSGTGSADVAAMKGLEQHLDRLIVGRSEGTAFAHFVAFRKTTEGTWIMLDSLSEQQQKISPSEYMDQQLKLGWAKNVRCVFTKP